MSCRSWSLLSLPGIELLVEKGRYMYAFASRQDEHEYGVLYAEALGLLATTIPHDLHASIRCLESLGPLECRFTKFPT